MADLGNLDWGEGKVGESGRGWMWAGLGLEPRGGMVKGWQLEVGCSSHPFYTGGAGVQASFVALHLMYFSCIL